MSDLQITAYGYCQCGCGAKTSRATRTRPKQGTVKGQHLPYMQGHHQRKPARDRFWDKVDRRGPDECWPWTRACNPKGYGQILVGGQSTGAHRVSYELECGPVSEGLHVLHSCDNPPCVNPAHLWVGTNADNVADREAKDRTSWASRNLGRANPRAELTEDDVVQIRMIYPAQNQRELAEHFGVRREAIGKVLRGERWAHVETARIRLSPSDYGAER